MYKAFHKIEELVTAVDTDKKIEGAGAYSANRFPVRFVLFDNFRDCYEFVSLMAEHAHVVRINNWMEKDYPDVMITYSKLSTFITDLLEQVPLNDLVIAPFSELARFYDNKNHIEFDTLISSIKNCNNSKGAYEIKRRVYIPIVGLAGKMSKFFEDSQSFIWYLKSDNQELNYRLILTNGTDYKVKGVREKYSMVENVYGWLESWNNQELTKTIVSTSPSIYANAEYAQPDNAFTFCPCENVHVYLTDGLGLDLKFIAYRPEDEKFWERLAKEIDIDSFQFEQFFNSRFDIHELANYEVFVKTWFNFHEQYDRWLLSAYYVYKFCNKGYICQALQNTHSYTNVDFVEAMVLSIFNLSDKEQYLEERHTALGLAVEQSIVISKEAQELLISKLQQLADDQGYVTTLKYVTNVTTAEKSLLIEWMGSGKICAEDVKNVYPELCAYMQPLDSLTEDEEWIEKYITNYKIAKIANKYTEAVKTQITELNASEVAFHGWYQNIKTTRTLLDGRDDIEVFFWIDGLGVDWIPFVKNIIEKHRHENYFLNDVMIGKALLPTTTSTNKEDLQKIVNGQLPKNGDIDEIAHQCRPYPQYIIDDMKVVADAINDILTKNPGRKIAIVSDHGMSFLPQLCEGLNLAGFQSDHGGRLATKKSGTATSDEKYVVLPDGKTVCALRHESLCAKIAKGSGCHGGCTPEEVLVPVFIVSNQPNSQSWTAVLKTIEVSTANPYVIFAIKGLKVAQKPYILYNDKKYALNKNISNEYQSENLLLDQQVQTITLQIGTDKQIFNISIKAGFEEEDLFADF